MVVIAANNWNNRPFERVFSRRRATSCCTDDYESQHKFRHEAHSRNSADDWRILTAVAGIEQHPVGLRAILPAIHARPLIGLQTSLRLRLQYYGVPLSLTVHFLSVSGQLFFNLNSYRSVLRVHSSTSTLTIPKTWRGFKIGPTQPRQLKNYWPLCVSGRTIDRLSVCWVFLPEYLAWWFIFTLSRWRS